MDEMIQLTEETAPAYPADSSNGVKTPPATVVFTKPFTMLSEYTYVNREQDLGDRGLRRAKQSYRSHHMIEKHTAKKTTDSG